MSNPAKRICPVCREYEFNEPFEDCPVCEWCNDIYQEDYPDAKGCGNLMSLNQAKARYAAGKKLYSDDRWWDER